MEIKKYVVLQQWGKGMTCIRGNFNDFKEACRCALSNSKKRKGKGAQPTCYVLERKAVSPPYPTLEGSDLDQGCL